MSQAKLKIRLLRSPIGCKAALKAVIAGLGLKRPNTDVELADTPAVRGMLAKVPHMVTWAAVDAAPAKVSRRKAVSGQVGEPPAKTRRAARAKKNDETVKGEEK